MSRTDAPAAPSGGSEIRQISLDDVGSMQFAPSSVAAIEMSDSVGLLKDEMEALSEYRNRRWV